MRLLLALGIFMASAAAAAACSTFDDAEDPASPDAGDDDARAPSPDGAAPPDGSADVRADADAGESDTTAARYRAAVLADEPIAYWRMGLTSLTIVPNEVDGGSSLALSGAFAAEPLGALPGDPAITFDGDEAYAIATSSKEFQFVGTASFTIECWARHDGHIDGGTSFEHVVSFLGGNPGSVQQNGYALYYNNSGVYFSALRAAPDVSPVEAPIDPPGAVGAWTHYVYVYDGQRILPYIDGQPKASKATKIAVVARGTELTIGNASNEKGRGFHGAIDEVAIYAKALSPQAIATHHATGRGQ